MELVALKLVDSLPRAQISFPFTLGDWKFGILNYADLRYPELA